MAGRRKNKASVLWWRMNDPMDRKQGMLLSERETKAAAKAVPVLLYNNRKDFVDKGGHKKKMTMQN